MKADALDSTQVSGPPRRPVRRGLYVLPSLFTLGNMLLGFYAIVSAFRGSNLVGPEASELFRNATWAVFIAAVLDTLDGRIARMTKTESEFGREFDSLADAFTFGVVPALLAFFWGLHDYGRIGWLIPAYYMVCTATRLARFNVQSKVTDSRWFVGLPSPAAAGAICSLLFYMPDQEWRHYSSAMMFGVLLLIGSLEVSTFRYWSFKRLDLRRRLSYRVVLPLAVVLVVLATEPAAFFLVVAILYTASGPLGWLTGRWGRKRPEGEPAS